MGVFRSERILHKMIRMPGDVDGAQRVLDALGNYEQDCIEFIDLNKDNFEAKKSFAGMIKRCDDMEMKINKFEMFAKDFSFPVYQYKKYADFVKDMKSDEESRASRFGNYYDMIESEIIEEERRIMDLIDSYTKIKEDLEIELEKKCVYDKYYQLVDSTVLNHTQPMVNSIHLESGYGDKTSSLLHIIGVIKADDDMKMRRMIFRASKGRAVVTFFDYVNNEHLELVGEEDFKIQKKIFVIFYPSDGREHLLTKLIHICDLFSASRFMPPLDGVNQAIASLQNTINEKKSYLREAVISIKDFLRNKCGSAEQPAKLDMYRLYFKKQKMIFTNLNKCILNENYMIGEAWILKKNFEDLKGVLDDINKSNRQSTVSSTFIDIAEANLPRPTYIISNEFLEPFQNIVNTYGIPRYQEINPAYFNIVTFPFLFGVMFGDIGHGLILLVFGLYLCIKAETIKNDANSSLKNIVKLRYFLLLLGFFAFYSGWIYNDFLSQPLPVFGSCYVDVTNTAESYAVKSTKDCVYPFGMDPKWYVSKNQLAYFNSFKMKLSVIIGVSHMIFGILLKGINEVRFRNWLRFWFEFLPQLLFMSALFGYMIVLIFIKWATNWLPLNNKAPSLISIMMNIFLKLGSLVNSELPVWVGKTGEVNDQELVSFVIFIICIVLVPIMLLPQPIIRYFRLKREEKIQVERMKNSDELSLVQMYIYIKGRETIPQSYLHNSEQINHHDGGFSEIFIHQAIETIEFILGSISNTASYLRLWALSLAHAELSKVFFEKTLLLSIEEGEYSWGFVGIFVGFFIFANVTFFVLMCMDFLECFLHTLRLHWVEFQNKFFKADGYLFKPYSFKYIVEADQ